MKIIVVGLGVQGKKRQYFAGDDCVATIDPIKPEADYTHIEKVPLKNYEAALVCLPDEPKYEIIQYLLTNNKHVLVEKPLWVPSRNHLSELQTLALQKRLVLYTAYNHRFEPHLHKMAELLKQNVLGNIYRCRLFYGNGTARWVRDTWRDREGGVLTDLAPHLLDLIDYWFSLRESNFICVDVHCHENHSPDHVVIINRSSAIQFQLEMSLLSWRNSFYCDIIGEKGSLHVDSLCKWGPAKLIERQRVLPSGRPIERVTTLIQDDQTWLQEYRYFKSLIHQGQLFDCGKDLWIYDQLKSLNNQAITEKSMIV